MMRQALRFRATGAVIPGATIPHRLLASVKLRTAGLTHRGGDIGFFENESLRGKTIDVRCLDLLFTIAGQLRAHVIHDDPEDVGFNRGCGCASGMQRSQRYDQQGGEKGECVFHFGTGIVTVPCFHFFGPDCSCLIHARLKV